MDSKESALSARLDAEDNNDNNASKVMYTTNNFHRNYHRHKKYNKTALSTCFRLNISHEWPATFPGLP